MENTDFFSCLTVFNANDSLLPKQTKRIDLLFILHFTQADTAIRAITIKSNPGIPNKKHEGDLLLKLSKELET